jgi:hypothetical protein
MLAVEVDGVHVLLVSVDDEEAPEHMDLAGTSSPGVPW